MSILYNRIESLCKDCSVSVTAMCKESGASRASLSDLKVGRKQNLSSDTISKISKFFGVPVDFFANTPPFDCWELIDQNRIGFLHYVDIDADTMQLVFGIDPQAPDATSMKDFIGFLSIAIKTATANAEGDWNIVLNPGYTKKAPTPKGARRISDDDIKFALFGGDGEITDAMYEEVKQFARMVKLREDVEKKKG